ncbi:unnamed protein product [Rotaria sordida]|uniref:WSC domain-containing protein n=1 Tax=Rotaria sordida TaxID=392033 RepID=A0A814NII0_9BILA|nr:unnamed protein product [Rotaria sordida]CAF1092727.1 unnamed protein product [Rotaria sordida]
MISITNTAYSSYYYVGCYTQIFYDTYFTSSYMEPTLCFRLCETSIIYIQDKICRCSGGGLMDHSRQRDIFCTIPCPTPGNRQVKATNNTCGGKETYSAYAEYQFYTRHAHLFEYRIKFTSCQFWNTSGYYDTLLVKIDESSVKSSLTKLDRCAGACLDQKVTTKSIAFNSDNNQCLCIMPQKLNVDSDRTLYLTILPNNSCNRYCDNTLGDSNVEHQFKCGSLNDSRIWAIYELIDLCPIDFIYIKELKECMSTYKGFWESCPSSSIKYVYDGNITWNNFLKVIEQLNLTKSIVTIDFDDDVTIDPSWKCPITTTTKNSNSSETSYFISSFFNTKYLLDNGCLRVGSYSWSSYSLSYHLCITYSISKDPLFDHLESYSIYTSGMNQILYDCPMNWLDLNGYCYQISDERKTIQEARNSCITVSEAEKSKRHEELIARIVFSDDDDDDDNDKKERHNKLKDYISDLLEGEIVQYTSHWQGRLGFFLLDTNISSNESTDQDDKNIPLLRSNININRSSMNEFQLIDLNVINNLTRKNDSCLVFTRSMIDDKESSILNNIQINNCSKPRHVLCRTKPIIARNFEIGCFHKPLTLGVPVMISNLLTFELCLSICKELETNIGVLHMNKCYCFNAAFTWIAEITRNHSKHKKYDCGNPCPGNKHERCGDENTIFIFYVSGYLFSSRFALRNKLDKPNPDFIFDDCINLNSVNPSTMYQFNFKRTNDIHPRHCLELCTNYKQKYALLNSNKCLCTNVSLKKKQDDPYPSLDFNCTRECPANYFYTCGNTSNSSIYSMYVMELNCPTGFTLEKDKRRCVYTNTLIEKNSFSKAQSYCKSIGGILAKMNDILEIQDVLLSSAFIFYTILSYSSSSYYSYSNPLDNKKYFWIDRTFNIINNNITLDHPIGRCSQTSESIDQNCILLRYQRILIENTTSYERCFTESNECSSKSAMPVCVDKHIEFDSNIIPSTNDNNPSMISINTSIDYSCGNDKKYHLIDQYCYKIDFHETTWQDAKAECERDNAMLFIPEKMMILKMIRLLFLRQRSYTSSSIAHVGFIYNNQNHTVMRYSTKNENILENVSDPDSFFYECESTFRKYYGKLSLSTKEKNQLKSQQTGCGYVDFRHDTDLSVSCDEIPCDRVATVICQKSPIRKIRAIIAKSGYIDEPVDDESNDQKSTKSIGRDFAPIFYVVGIVFILILLVFIGILYNQYVARKKNNGQHNEPVYSPLLMANEFDLS